MNEFSFRKTALFIGSMVILYYLKPIIGVFKNIYGWFAESLSFMRDLPEDARAAIAFFTIIWFVMLVWKTGCK